MILLQKQYFHMDAVTFARLLWTQGKNYSKQALPAQFSLYKTIYIYKIYTYTYAVAVLYLL